MKCNTFQGGVQNSICEDYRVRSNQPECLLVVFFIFKITHCIHIQISLKFIHQIPSFSAIGSYSAPKTPVCGDTKTDFCHVSNSKTCPLWSSLHDSPDRRLLTSDSGAKALLSLNPTAFGEKFKVIWDEWNERTYITDEYSPFQENCFVLVFNKFLDCLVMTPWSY